jgi:uracil-DNA glycosylase
METTIPIKNPENLYGPFTDYNCSFWADFLYKETKKPYMKELSLFLKNERKLKKIHPAPENVFRVFHATSYDSVQVVILGQDPYCMAGQADGLAFSTRHITTPASLKNIQSEICRSVYPDKNVDYLFTGEHEGTKFINNELSFWALQGVFLLNSCLTVQEGLPGSHYDKGWEDFTKAVIWQLNLKKKPIVYMLWGKKAKSFKEFIAPHHVVLEASHPSPKSADKGFMGCNHFNLANQVLLDNYGKIIFWHNRKEWNHLINN